MANYAIPEISFTKSERKKTRLRLAIAGVSGSGKTWTALAIGCAIAKAMGGRVAFGDTEHESSAAYADEFDFDSFSLKAPFMPELFEAAIKSAEKTHCVLILDSYSHEWIGSGGCLEINETLAREQFKGNTWAAWNLTTPRHRSLTETILSSPLHIICTMRSKQEMVQEGKKVFKLGMKTEQRDGSDYEFTTVLNMQHDTHLALVDKDRTKLFTEPFVPSHETGMKLWNWLNEGVDAQQRSSDMIDGYIEDMRKAKNIDDLQTVFSLANIEAKGFAELRDKIIVVKDECKAKFVQPQKTAYQSIHDDILSAMLPVDLTRCEQRAKSLENKHDCEQLLAMAHHRRTELEGNTLEFIAPNVDRVNGDSSIPEMLKDEMDYMLEINTLETIKDVDAMVKCLEAHSQPDERKRLLVEANKKRQSITFNLENPA